MMRAVALAIVGLVACGHPAVPAPPPTNQGSGAPPPATGWEVPAGWRGETIPFPLEFAPTLTHAGVEELRFPPGFFDPKAPDYWSYAFVWRLKDEAILGGMEIGDELTVYFRGLITAVDKDHHVTAPDQIAARAMDVAHPAEERGDILLALHVHLFDGFNTGQAIDLSGTAWRTSCPDGGALWAFVLSPVDTMDTELEDLARSARCDQAALPAD